MMCAEVWEQNECNFIKTTAGSSTKNKLWLQHSGCFFPVPSSSSSSSSLCFLVLDVWSTQSRLNTAPHLRVQQSAYEDHGRAHPVPGSEGVLEVNDGEDEAEELSQCHHQGDGQRGTLCGQDENTTDAHIPEVTG